MTMEFLTNGKFLKSNDLIYKKSTDVNKRKLAKILIFMAESMLEIIEK